MKLQEFTNDPAISEQIPTSIGIAGVSGSMSQGQQPGQQQLGQQQPGEKQTLQQTNPATAALAAKDQMERKKQIQDQITQAEKQLQDLRKQLAQVS